MVLGTPTTLMPFSTRALATPWVSSPPMVMMRVELVGLDAGQTLVDTTLHLARVGARGAQDGAPQLQDAGYGGQGEGHGFVRHNTAPAFDESRQTHRCGGKTPLRTAARITALSPGQSPPPVSIPTRMFISSRVQCKWCLVHRYCGAQIKEMRGGEVGWEGEINRKSTAVGMTNSLQGEERFRSDLFWVDWNVQIPRLARSL